MVYIVMVDLFQFATDGRRVELQHRQIVMPTLTGNFNPIKKEKGETIKFEKNTLLWLLRGNNNYQDLIDEISKTKNDNIYIKLGDNVYFKKNSTNTTLSDAGIYKSEIIIDTGNYSSNPVGYIFKQKNGNEWFVIQFTKGPTISVVDGMAIVGLKDSIICFHYITNYSTKTIQQIKLDEGTLYVQNFSNGKKEYGVHLNEKDKLVVDENKYYFGGKELTGDELEKVKDILSKDKIEDLSKDTIKEANWSGKALTTAAAIGIGTSLAYLYKKSKKSRKTISSSRSPSRVKSSRKKRRRS